MSGGSHPRRAGPIGVGRQLCERLRAQIADGTLAGGARLPSTRALAAELRVSRTTVTAAYEQLAAEGYLVTAPGRAARVAVRAAPVRVGRKRGGMVRPAVDAPRLSAYGQRLAAMQLPLPAAPVRIDFLYGAVAAQDFPARALRRAVQASQTRSSSTLRYIEPEGDAGLRRALQGYLARARGLVCEVEQVLVVHGSQQAIDLCARLLLDPADAFVIEDPGYLTARRSFEATGARCITVPVDEHGLLTQALPDDPRIRLAYVTPSHQFPLGGVLPIARRHELLAWAERHRAWILEDDYDGEFRYGQRPIDALQSIDHQERVVYVGTFSKALSPQLRLGYMVLPPELVRVFRQAKQLADRHAPVLDQQALAALIDSGGYERHVRRTRREHERRRAALLEAAARHLPHDAQLAGLAAGLHAVLWLPGRSPSDEPSIVAAARAVGVGVYPVSPLFAQPPELSTPRPAGLILGYASLTPAEVTQGLRLLGGVLQGLGEPRR
jgi:GntR family transcriptional regulator/MocR family aminotransferase